MLPDIINEAAVKENGVRREALFFSFFVFLQKFGAGIAIYITNLIIEEVGGYDSQIPGGIPNQPDTVAFPMRVMVGIVPAAMILISVAFAVYYPLSTDDEGRIKRKMEQIREAKKAEQSQTTNTPAAVERGTPAKHHGDIDG
jgi:Na+/melibiose symporter-like transporter